MKYLMRSVLLFLVLGLSVCTGHTESEESSNNAPGAACPVASGTDSTDVDDADLQMDREGQRKKSATSAEAWPDRNAK